MDLHEYEQEIIKGIEQYERNPNMKLYKKVKKQIDVYEIHLSQGYAGLEQQQFLQNQKNRLAAIRTQKTTIKDEDKIKQKVFAIGDDIDKNMKAIHQNLQEGIQVSTYIRLELERQIQALDELESENIEYNKRVKKVKKGLKVIIKRAMANKITKFLLVLVILGIIGLVVVYILKANNVFPK